MRWRAYLVVSAWLLSVPLSLARAEQTLQQKYLDIYLTINTAEHLEKQGDLRGALDDFKDCYSKLAKIHDSDPNWETALVVHRMDDCKTKILELEPKVEAMPPPGPPPVAPSPDQNSGITPPSPTPDYNNPTPPQPGTSTSGGPDEVNSLRLQLQAVKQELDITRQKLSEASAQNETYRVQLQTVNAQLDALKGQQSVDQRMGKLLNDNKALTAKLAAAEKELDDIKSNPKSKLALAQAQLKNLQDQYDASQEANKALQDTTTTLKTQLDQAQADLVAANQKLAAAGPGSPEYATIKRENEVMRDILRRELQEQAHRDMAKRLAQEEFDNLKLKSQVLQEQFDIATSPMVAPTTDEERTLLAGLKVPGPDVAPPPDAVGNNLSAPANGATATTDPATNPASVTPSASSASTDTNTASVTPPSTSSASDTSLVTTNTVTPTAPTVGADNATNEAPVTIVMNTPTSGDPATPAATTTATDPSSTNAPSSVTQPATPAPTTDPTSSPTNSTATAPASTPDPNAPIPPVTPPGQPASSVAVSNNTGTTPSSSAPTDSNAPTTSHVPPGTTTYTDTTIQNGGSNPTQADPTQYSTRARLPDDMRETAQDAADLFKNQKYDESAAKYQSIIEKYPESLYAWSNLGVVRFQQGKYEEALKALQQAVKLSPTDAFSYSNLGIVYYQLNQYENAIDALNSAKALDPNDAKTHNYLGCAESQKGWQEVAEKEFRRSIEIDPNFGDAHFNLALVYATSKPPSLELARREYNRALELGIAKDSRLEKLLAGAQ